MTKLKFLIIRFSSIGDVTQALSIPSKIADKFPDAEIHWVTRYDFKDLVGTHPCVHKVWVLDRRTGFKGLLRLIEEMKQQNFTHVYDAHNNLRSHLISLMLRPRNFIRKSQKRWKRFLLFKFRINTYEMPFSGQRDLLEPLAAWDINLALPPAPQLSLDPEFVKKSVKHFVPSGFSSYVALAPSAAFELKRWPVEYWKKLIEIMPEQNFVLLGGKHDHFIADITTVAPNRCMNLAGYCTLLESAALIEEAQALVVNDTGLLHLAEQRGKACIALMGPAPFGFPSRPSTKIMELDLKCRPCSKHGQGPCVNSEFHKCLRGISPEQVRMTLLEILQKLRQKGDR